MELQVSIADSLRVDEDGFLVCSGRDYTRLLRGHHQEKGLALLSRIVNGLGQRSATAQKLKQVITTSSKLFGSDQRIYIKVAGTRALGFVKVGERKLFYHDYTGSIKELTPTAVLDIYVHQSCQRSGVGKEVFEKFLITQNKTPEKLAYDRPSEKLIGFLKKHYSLSAFLPQNNNFVIFDRFFGEKSKPIKEDSRVRQGKEQGKPSQLRLREQEDSLQLLANEMKGVKMEQKGVIVEQEKRAIILSQSLRESKGVNGVGLQQTSFKQTKDQTKSSFGCPWAIEEKIGFRTTSNAYGNYYRR